MEDTASPPLDSPLEGPTARVFRRVGLLLFLIAALLPYHGCRASPGEFMDPPEPWASFDRANDGISGAAFAEKAVRELVLGESRFFPSADSLFSGDEDALLSGDRNSGDRVGPGVFLALPFWAVALLLVRVRRSRVRWLVGALLWLSLAILFVLGARDALEVRPGSGPKSFLVDVPWSDPVVRRLPTMAFAAPHIPWSWPLDAWVWLSLAGGLLLLRPRLRWEIPDVEATVSSQAVLGLGLCLITPCAWIWEWSVKDDIPVSAVLQAGWVNYRIGFWLALAALSLIAAPLFVPEKHLSRLYDRCRPWRSRSTTPTPTPPGSTPP